MRVDFIKWMWLSALSTIILIGSECAAQPLCANVIYEEQCCDHPCFSLGVDWLYWKIKQDNMNAGTFIDDYPDPSFKYAHFTIIDPKTKMQSGVRVNSSYCLPCTQWELHLNGTYVPIPKIAASAVASVETDERSQYIIGNNSSYPFLQNFQAFNSLYESWEGWLSYLDFNIRRNLNFCYKFFLSPYLGIRGAWSNQNFLMEGNLQTPSINNSNFGSIEFKQCFQGYGIEGGFWTEWRWGCGFAVVGHLDTSILYSIFNTKNESKGYLAESSTQVFLIEGNLNNYAIIPTINYFIGLQYVSSICTKPVSLLLGWEQLVFFHLNRMAVNGGDFSAQGLTLGVNVMF